MSRALQLLAGPRAFALLEERGFRTEDVDVFAGASGGPKWLVLSGLDRVLFGLFAERRRPLDLLGSSIGSWRMACLAQADPVAAVERLEHAYIEQQYSRRPTPADVTRVAAGMLDHVLGENGAREILAHPWARLHAITVRARGIAASERKATQIAGLAFAAIANLFDRRSLAWQFERVIFDSARGHGPFRELADLPTRHVALTAANLRAALLASGSIPLVLEGVRVPDAPAGIYRDGGITDYHLDLDYGRGDGIVLYPHFYPYLVPGWFDKSLRWRRAAGSNLDRMLLLAPTREFIRTLPGGRIPDRKDFYRHDPAARMRQWRRVCDAGRRLGDEFAEHVATGRWMDHIRPLSSR